MKMTDVEIKGKNKNINFIYVLKYHLEHLVANFRMSTAELYTRTLQKEFEMIGVDPRFLLIYLLTINIYMEGADILRLGIHEI